MASVGVQLPDSALTCRSLEIEWLGRLDYNAATALQEERRERVLADHSTEYLLLLEHSPTFTLGRNADHGDVKASPAWMKANGVVVAESDRGGDVTYHGPGQLVGYPILDLDPDRRDIRRYIRDLQQVLVLTLADLGVVAEGGVPGRPAGVWIGDAKIASIGVHLRRWVTTHGFALNVSTHLEHFEGIIACGLPNVTMTSVERQTGTTPDLARVASLCSDHFLEVFDRQPTPRSPPGAPR